MYVDNQHSWYLSPLSLDYCDIVTNEVNPFSQPASIRLGARGEDAETK